MQKTTREAVRTLEPYGFKLQGVDGGGHLVFRTDEGVALRLSNSTKANNVEFLRRRAAQTINAQKKASATFIHHLREKYGVGDYDRKVLKLNPRAEAKEWAEANDVDVVFSTMAAAVSRSDFVEVIKAPKVGGDPRSPNKGWGEFALIGDLYGTDVPEVTVTEEKPVGTCDVRIDLPGGGVAVCSRTPGHEGEHQDKYRHVSWDATEAEDIAQAQQRYEEWAKQYMPAPSPTPPVVTEAVTEAPSGRDDQVKALLSGLESLLAAPNEAEAETQAKLDLAIEALTNVQVTISGLLGVLRDGE